MSQHLDFLYAQLSNIDKQLLTDVAANSVFRKLVEEALAETREALIDMTCDEDYMQFVIDHATAQAKYAQLKAVLDLLKVMNYDLIIVPQNRSE